jgi:ribosomal protein S18 acetylase RimI-like enzyme
VKNEHIITNTTMADWSAIMELFEAAIRDQASRGRKVWASIDAAALKRDIANGLQYKMIVDGTIVCLFSALYADPLIWGDRDQQDAIYLHRIVVNPDQKGNRLFQQVLDWACDVVRQKKLRYVRMDTWADNDRIISYYESFGFRKLDTLITGDSPDLPEQNRNLHIALLQYEV